MDKKNNPVPELLAPAGNMDRLMSAYRFGADAVYLGARAMSLRNFADNFTYDELAFACDYGHSIGKRVYVACNAFARDEDIDALPEMLEQIGKANPDALIVNDIGVISTAKRVLPDMTLHLSTQANTLNSEAVRFYYDIGIKRIILARELSLEQIKRMRQRVPDGVELEMFVHGAMCISYSGRCLLSNYITGRDSNCGECAQPCRWTYEMRERGKDGEYFSIEEDGRGTYVLNSRDLNLIRYIDKIADAGICSLKIEGRMKSVAYVAAVTNAYRMAIDAYSRGDQLSDSVIAELEYVSHRPYTTGFAFGDPGSQGQATLSGGYIGDARIAAIVEDYDELTQTAHVFQRNKFFDGDTLMVLSPSDVGRSFEVHGIKNLLGERQECAPHPEQELFIGCSQPLKKGDILRKRN